MLLSFLCIRLPVNLYLFFLLCIILSNKFLQETSQEKNTFFLFLYNYFFQHFGWISFWFVLVGIFLQRKNNFFVRWLYFFSVPIGFCILAGFLWPFDSETLFTYFGGLAVLGQKFTENSLLGKIIFITFFTIALYLVISRYQIHSAWRIVFLFFLNISNNMQVFFKKYIDKTKWVFYTNNILKQVNKFLPQKNSKKKENTPTKDNLNQIKKNLENDSLDNSVKELLSIFHSFNKTHKKNSKF